MAIRRGATDAAADHPRKADRTSLGSAPVRYGASRCRASPPPTSCAPLLDPLIKADDAAGAEAQLLTYAPQLSVEARAEAGTARRLRLLCARARHGRAPRRRHLAPGRDRRMGEPGGLGLRPRLVAARRLRTPPRPPSSRSPSSPSSASFAPAAIYWAARAEQAAGRPALGRAAAQGRGDDRRIARKLLRPARARNARHGDQARRPTRSSASTRRSTNMPNVQRAIELARIGEPALAEEMLRHQAKIGAADRASRADPARQEARPARRPAVARQQRPVRRARRTPTDRYPNPRWTPAQRLARRSRARLRPHRPGIGLPPHRGQHRRRGRADAGAARSPRSRCRAAAACPTRARRLTDPTLQPRIRPELHRDDARLIGAPPGQLPRVIASYNAGPLPVAAGRRSTTRAIRCCGSNPSLIGKPAITCRRCCGTCGSIRASTTRTRRP